MLKKESLEALRRVVESMLVLFAIPLALLWDRFFIKFGWDFSDIFSVVLVATVVAFAVYSGATIFQSEKKDRAFEYLFSLPVSRFEILKTKILPRLVMLLALIVILAFFTGLKSSFDNGITFLFLFFISIFLSLTIHSVIIGLLGVMLLYYIYYFIYRILLYFSLRYDLRITGFLGLSLGKLIPALLLLIPFGIAFWLTFKKMDVKPMKLQMRTYYAIVLPTLAVLITFFTLMFKKYLLDY
jgi:ABC-type transport system involved in multi-copper enzyme maturation permease subunit